MIENFKKFWNYLFSILKIKSVHPRLGAGTIGTIILLIASFVELVTGLPLISKNIINTKFSY